MGPDEESGLQAPLLCHQQEQQQQRRRHHVGHLNQVEELLEELPRPLPQSTVTVSVLNLTCTILGAGMFALPAAFSGLGLLGGALMVAAVGAVTYLSVVVIIRASERAGKLTFAETMGAVWGPGAAVAVRLSIILACGGFLVLYLLVLVDVSIGGPDFSGVIRDLVPSLPDPPPWYLSRCALLTWCALAVAPLLPARTLGGLARVSGLKVACSLLCMTALAWLAVAAGRQGKLHRRLLPDPEMYGPGFVKTLTQAMGTVPVIMTALICQFNIHPLMQDLRGYTPRRMRTVAAITLTATSLVYATAGGCGYAVFGRDVKGDVLASLCPEVVGELLGSARLGLAFVAAIKVSVALVMLCSFPMVMFPLRADLTDAILGATGGKALGATGFYAVTYATLALIWGSAILIKSAYQMTGLVGAVCGIAVGFIFPGMLAWRGESGLAWRAFAVVLLVLGTLLMAAGIVAPLLDAEEGGESLAAAVLGRLRRRSAL